MTNRMLLLSASLVALTLAHGASAQTLAAAGSTALTDAAALTEAAVAAQAAGAVEAVVVTGSRLNTGFNTPTPVTTVGTEQIQQRAASTVGELLNELPSFRASSGPGVLTNGTVSSAQSLLDLRSLGSTRTLVLVDGHRPTPVNANSTFDVNLIPTGLVARTEVVTGGASAAYGSDAVAGVVNLILDSHYEGFKGDVRYGESQRNDNVERYVSLAYGRSFAGGKGHFVLGGDWTRNEGVGNLYNRAWGRKEPGALSLPTNRAAGLPANIISYNVELSAVTPYGLISSGPLAGTAFNAQGQPYAFSYGSIRGATEMIGTGNYGNSEYNSMDLRPAYERAALLGRLEYELTPSITAFAEYHYGSLSAHGHSGTCCNTVTYVIGRDNAFLPDSIRQAMITNNLATINVGRRNQDYPWATASNTLQNYQGVFGLKGDVFGGWKWDATYTTGSSRVKATQVLQPRVADQQHSAYAVRNAQGQIVCGPVATDPWLLSQAASQRDGYAAQIDAGCVPSNVFGAADNAAAVAYYLSDARQRISIGQQTFSANLSGEPFRLPAGPVSVAIGGEWRKNSLDAVGCPDCVLGKLTNQNFPSFSGDINVKEGYAEVGAPILAGLSLVKSLSVNGAVRLTDYSTSGSVTTWKVGGEYEPIDGLRFRLTRSRDIRAPNISELFNPGSNGRANLTNKLNGVSNIVASKTAGNPNLKPEVADTLTAGVVFQPAFLRGFRVSVDYFRINISDVIGSVGAQDVLDRYLLQGLKEYEPYIVFNNTALGVSQVNSTYLNMLAQKNEGVDFEAAYRAPIDKLGLPGQFDVRVLGTYYAHLRTLQTLPDGTVSDIDYAGVSSAVPHWQGNLNLAYRLGRFSSALNARFTSKIRYSATLVGPDDPAYNPASSNSINQNLWRSNVNFSLNAAYDIIEPGERRLQVYGVIDNLFDKDPPVVAFSLLSGASPYDVIGRSFKVGVRFAY
jgi:outer membrane receptor protein involved in Fe transport